MTEGVANIDRIYVSIYIGIANKDRIQAYATMDFVYANCYTFCRNSVCAWYTLAAIILSMLAILQLSWFCLCLVYVSCHDSVYAFDACIALIFVYACYAFCNNSVYACYTAAVMILSLLAIRQLSWFCLCWLYVSCHHPVYACYTSAVMILFMFSIRQLSWFCLWLLHQPWFCLFFCYACTAMNFVAHNNRQLISYVFVLPVPHLEITPTCISADSVPHCCDVISRYCRYLDLI